jgi:hypothetical protein
MFAPQWQLCLSSGAPASSTKSRRRVLSVTTVPSYPPTNRMQRNITSSTDAQLRGFCQEQHASREALAVCCTAKVLCSVHTRLPAAGEQHIPTAT